jgi:hypothetical protein
MEDGAHNNAVRLGDEADRVRESLEQGTIYASLYHRELKRVLRLLIHRKVVELRWGERYS